MLAGRSCSSVLVSQHGRRVVEGLKGVGKMEWRWGGTRQRLGQERRQITAIVGGSGTTNILSPFLVSVCLGLLRGPFRCQNLTTQASEQMFPYPVEPSRLEISPRDSARAPLVWLNFVGLDCPAERKGQSAMKKTRWRLYNSENIWVLQAFIPRAS